MTINYILLVVTGFWSAIGIYHIVKDDMNSRPLFTIFAIIVFVIALIATIKGINYYDFIKIIEQKNNH